MALALALETLVWAASTVAGALTSPEGGCWCVGPVDRVRNGATVAYSCTISPTPPCPVMGSAGGVASTLSIIGFKASKPLCCPWNNVNVYPDSQAGDTNAVDLCSVPSVSFGASASSLMIEKPSTVAQANCVVRRDGFGSFVLARGGFDWAIVGQLGPPICDTACGNTDAIGSAVAIAEPFMMWTGSPGQVYTVTHNITLTGVIDIRSLPFWPFGPYSVTQVWGRIYRIEFVTLSRQASTDQSGWVRHGVLAAFENGTYRTLGLYDQLTVQPGPPVTASGSIEVVDPNAEGGVRLSPRFESFHSLGDVNRDSIVCWRDRVLALGRIGSQISVSSGYDVQADWDLDGMISEFDVAAFLSYPCSADVNCDQTVDFGDILEFLNLYNTSSVEADLNLDDAVDFNDFLAFQNAFDRGC